MHHPHLADYFEDFTRPHTSHMNNLANAATSAIFHHATATGVTYGSSSPAVLPSFLPIEDIYVLPQHQPPNPEDEDDVVPDQHAAFGITRAMERRRDAVWRDLGLQGLVERNGLRHGNNVGGRARRGGLAGGGMGGSRRGGCLR
jgi:hypothetical protein